MSELQHDDPDQEAAPSSVSSRLRREADQLRVNLGRRKQQARARQQTATVPDEEVERP